MKNNKFVVFFDLDDVFYLTGQYINQNIIKYLRDKQELDEVDRIMMDHLHIPKQDFLTLREDLERINPELAKKIDDIVWEHGLRKNGFIIAAPFDPEIRQLFIDLVNAGRVEVGICTHRKSIDPQAEMTTRALIRDLNGTPVKHIYVLDRKTHPNKLDVLQQFHPNFVLVDDNPIYGDEVLDTDSRLIIWDKQHRIPRYVNQRSADNIIKLQKHLTDLIYR